MAKSLGNMLGKSSVSMSNMSQVNMLVKPLVNMLAELLANLCFFSIWLFFHKDPRLIVHQVKTEALTPLYHFHQFHRHLDICHAITAGNSSLHIASIQTQTGKLCFPDLSC